MYIDSDTETSHVDWLILLPIAGLLMFSVAFVYSASSTFSALKFGSSEQLFWNHAFRVIIGIALMIFVAKIDYHFWERTSATLLLISIGFLLMVLLMGQEVNPDYTKGLVIEIYDDGSIRKMIR